MLSSKKQILTKLAMLAVAAAALVAMAAFAFADSNAQGCPGNGNSAQANAGQRAELVAQAKAAAKESGANFGSVQSGYNHSSCSNGNQGG